LITGSDRFSSLQDDHYTTQIYASANGLDRAGLFAHFTNLAQRIEMFRFVRPVEPEQFHEGVTCMANHIRGDSPAGSESK
jgi:hypothetical protein